MQKLRSLVHVLNGSQAFNVLFLVTSAAVLAWAIHIDISADNFGRGISLVLLFR